MLLLNLPIIHRIQLSSPLQLLRALDLEKAMVMIMMLADMQTRSNRSIRYQSTYPQRAMNRSRPPIAAAMLVLPVAVQAGA